MSKIPILVVDDSDFDRKMLVKALSIKGKFPTIEAKSGDECLEIVNTQRVGIILMDIMMPGISGTDVLKKIRKKFNPIELPIIMITAKTKATDIISCLQDGANDYITKPVNFEIAVSRISTHLKLAEISRQMSRLKEMAALDAMITTYNHEINNPLTIAIACLKTLQVKDETRVEKLKSALWRIADIVKKIRTVTDQKEAEYQDYTESSKMVKVR